VRVHKSLLIIKSHIDRRGSILASGDSEMLNYERDNYSYFWPRDGAFVIWPLIRLGYTEEAKAFFEFCRDVISADGYLMHKYQPDRALGSSWHPYVRNNKAELPIQEDETAITIFMISQYLKISNDEDFVRNLYPTLIRPRFRDMTTSGIGRAPVRLPPPLTRAYILAIGRRRYRATSYRNSTLSSPRWLRAAGLASHGGKRA